MKSQEMSGIIYLMRRSNNSWLQKEPPPTSKNNSYMEYNNRINYKLDLHGVSQIFCLSVPQNLRSSLGWIQFSKYIWSYVKAFILPDGAQDNFPEYIHNEEVTFY